MCKACGLWCRDPLASNANQAGICQYPSCGNGRIDQGESCDGNNLGSNDPSKYLCEKCELICKDITATNAGKP